MNFDYRDWAFAVGHYILNFGAVDLTVSEFLEARLGAKRYASVRDKPLHARLDEVQHLLSGERLLAFHQLRAQIEPYRKLRNHIAHGYLLALHRSQGGTESISMTVATEQRLEGLAIAETLDPQTVIKKGNEVCDLASSYRDFFGLYSG